MKKYKTRNEKTETYMEAKKLANKVSLSNLTVL
jgi:hypothetical protein